MNKDVLCFFLNGTTHLSFLTHFRIVNRGFVIGVNFDLVLGRQSKQILLFHVGKNIILDLPGIWEKSSFHFEFFPL